MTDKQLALAAIEALNKARDLLESSSDQAQHEIAEEVGVLVRELKSLKFFGRPLVCGIGTDPETGEYVITNEYEDGYVVLAQFKRLADAKRYLKNMGR